MTVSNLAQMLYQAAATSSGITVYNDVGLLSSKRTSYKDILAIAAKKANWIKCLPNICCTKVVLLHFASFQENIEWFWAALLTGLLPTISTPLPLDDARRRVHLTHLRNILLHPIILTSSNLAKDFAGVEDIRLEFTNLVSSFKSHDDEDIVDNTASTTAPAALMLTSGSSGNAKAVVLRHEQIIASVKGKSSAFGTTGADVFLNWIGFDHVACVIETHIHAMYLGAELVHVPAPRLVSDPTVFLHLIQTHQVSYTFAPHFFLARLLQNIQDPASREIRFDISCLRHLISGGESNLVETIIALTKALQIYGLRGEVIRPGFGMTETCAGSFYALDSPSYDIEMGNVFASLGKPIAGIQMRVTNADGQGARHGESGDLQVIGSIVFREYFNNLQASRASFTSDGWFVTGDRAYIDAHGNLNIVGREKDSINVNGIKYFPNDIETALESASIPGLTTSYTAVFSHRPAGSHSEEICVVYHPTFDLDDIANRVETASKIVLVVGSLTTCRPKHIIPLPHVLLQKSALGKLSRAKIKATFESGLYGKYEDSRNDKVRSFKAARREVPSTETEHIIWAALQELIDIPEEEAGVSNSIFDFGITSTDLFALKKRFEETLCIPSPVPIGLLLTTPTIRGIANELDALKQSAADVLVFVALAKFFSDRRVYGLRTRGLNTSIDDNDYFTSIAEIADCYVTSIRQHQPQGPYAIAGYSLGSTVAFEVAKRLEAANDKVAFLGMLDSPPHMRRLIEKLAWPDVLLNVAYFLELISETDSIDVAADIRRLSPDQALDFVMARAPRDRLDALAINKARLHKLTDVTNAFGMAGKNYEPEGLVRRMDVFWVTPLQTVAASRREWMEEHLSRWKDFSLEVPRFHECEGSHAKMLNAECVASFQMRLKGAMAARGV